MATRTSIFATNDNVTAADLNSLAGPWNTYTPTLAQGASTDIAKNIVAAKYLQFGKLVIVQLFLGAAASGTAGSGITVTLPVTSAGSGYICGVGNYYDQSPSTFYAATAGLVSTTAVSLYRADTNYSDAIGADPNLAVASGDSFQAFMIYEAA